jgi:hypothetical protein
MTIKPSPTPANTAHAPPHETTGALRAFCWKCRTERSLVPSQYYVGTYYCTGCGFACQPSPRSAG